MLRRAARVGGVPAGARGVVAPGQYSPLHQFRTGKQPHGTAAVSSREDFQRLVANPGPIRVTYADDYLDWYYRAYTERVKHQAAQEQRVSAVAGSSSRRAGVEAATGLSASYRPASGSTMQHGLTEQEKAVAAIDDAATQHGRLDLFERQPQFPAIHIDRCKPHHIYELLDEHVISHEVSSDDVWRRALLYRGMLKARKASYPSSFNYALKAIDDCVFSFAAGPGDGPKLADGSAVPSELIGEAATAALPTLAAAEYYERLALQYHVENSVEAHVVLRCHHKADSDMLLISKPAPLTPDEIDSRWNSAVKDVKQAESAAELPAFPSLPALLSDPRNLPLATLLLFAELNCHVSCDPFTKYKHAMRAVLRPTPSEVRDLERSRSIVDRMGTARTSLLPSARFAQLIDSRARDIMRLESAHSASDADWYRGRTGDSKFARASTGKDLVGDGAADPSIAPPTFNHRAVRAEVRDVASRRIMRGLRDYGHSRAMTTHIDDIGQFELRNKFVPASPSSERYRATVLKPTPQHFLRLLLGDRHIGLCLTLLRDRRSPFPPQVVQRLSPTQRAPAEGDAPRPTSGHELATKLRRQCEDHAGLMYTTALDYHVEQQRRVQLQALQVSAGLLDSTVNDCLVALRALHEQTTEHNTPLATLREPYMPVADRHLDEFGFPTAARVEDYKRWVAAPPAAA